jgi:hypothetical protein
MDEHLLEEALFLRLRHGASLSKSFGLSPGGGRRLADSFVQVAFFSCAPVVLLGGRRDNTPVHWSGWAAVPHHGGKPGVIEWELGTAHDIGYTAGSIEESSASPLRPRRISTEA